MLCSELVLHLMTADGQKGQTIKPNNALSARAA